MSAYAPLGHPAESAAPRAAYPPQAHLDTPGRRKPVVRLAHNEDSLCKGNAVAFFRQTVRQTLLIALVLPAAAALPWSAWAASPSAAASSVSSDSCTGLLKQNFLRLQDEKPQSLCQYQGKVVVAVNTASFCGFTSQYRGLEDLHAKYKDRGLVVLGFPSNDFSQETGSNKEIADFCESTFGVKFPMFT